MLLLAHNIEERVGRLDGWHFYRLGAAASEDLDNGVGDRGVSTVHGGLKLAFQKCPQRKLPRSLEKERSVTSVIGPPSRSDSRLASIFSRNVDRSGLKLPVGPY
ncbi:hypothetical protein LMG9964_06730 [Paraburkholderia phenoliruptrix]|uniref:Uncharacterized protein n=1 Tax=Paraburkholderia phenoliruptrix TaxID=252970 RepID=A0A6J5KFF9_9BURK|nr:hypothetical protein LMG9964_06730 [Paraburkholderia phenoliruptrix]